MARRSQIVAATIAVMADGGYPQTTFARIAEQAQLSSTRLISYHFADKGELMGAVAAEVIGGLSEYMSQQVMAETTSADSLRAYIQGVVTFTATHRSEMKALLEIFLNGALGYDADTDTAVVSHVEAILRQGQQDGEFRDFDPRVVATAIQRAVDGLPLLLESVPDLDCAGFANELVTLFELGTRRSPA
jgi:AcrR family transcriptional regulator